ncbi:MAG: class I SAM-dependent methyltransferase [Bacteroidota bacterium]
MFNEESYKRHGQWYNSQFPDEKSKIAQLQTHQLNKSGRDIGQWLQNLFFGCIDPLTSETAQRWLTIGDAYGFDAQYLLGKGQLATASDLNTDFLKLAKNEGIIDDFSAQNAELLSYPANTFDYLLCKEAYHHFPRPYAALYEMIRVAKKGMVLIEPQDPISKMPLLLMLMNLLSGFKDKFSSKIWKNRFSYEPVGNFVYKISAREMEKFAAGLNLPLVAFKGINPNYYFKGAEQQESSLKKRRFRWIYIRKKFADLGVFLKLIPSQVLCAIAFKELPEEGLLKELKKAGYQLVYIPKNPYA